MLYSVYRDQSLYMHIHRLSEKLRSLITQQRRGSWHSCHLVQGLHGASISAPLVEVGTVGGWHVLECCLNRQVKCAPYQSSVVEHR